jgi:DNA-directed RNA polymerase subunit alpha
MIKFERPGFKVKAESETSTSGTYIVGPLERGFGTTLGNSIRRVLLSSIPGAAVVGVRIEGVKHEYQSIEGVVEDATEIILNLKDLVVVADNENEVYTLTINKSKEGAVTASDIEVPLGIEVINGDLEIANISKGGSISIEIFVTKNRGYKLVEENKKYTGGVGVIATDANFSPVERVNYTVEPIKVGEDADVEQVTFEIETNGSIVASEALTIASKILIGHLELLLDLDKMAADFNVIKDVNESAVETNADIRIEDLDLSVRSYNCLKRAGIITIGEVAQKTEPEMMNTKKLGKKSLKEIKEKLDELGLGFKK